MPTMPLASAYAPNRMVSASRLIPGQTSTTTPNATERRPFKPRAHLSFVSCVPAVFMTWSYVDSIWTYLPAGRLTARLSLGPSVCGIGDETDGVRELCNPYRRRNRT